MERDPRFEAARRRLHTVAVTGTNGKTTTVAMLAAIVGASGEVSARVTTVGAWVGEERVAGGSLRDEFLATVERAVARGARTLALETTSKALLDGIARQWPPDVAVFTNLSRDHLDLHGSAEAYLAAKAQLFLALPPGGTAVLNADDPASALLREVLPAGVRTLTWSARGAEADLVATAIALGVGSTRAEVRGLGALELRVTGEVNVGNALAASLAARALGHGDEVIRAGLAAFPGVPGRFEVVHHDPLVVVDYAHTPDGLRGALVTARRLCRGQLVVVFGCGGERDRGKRPAMGAVADRLADVVVLTTDNPRREDPAAITREVWAQHRARWLDEPDRARAIARALALAGPGDAVVVAGKGHEDVQEVGDERRPFSDRATLLELLAP